jgi:uncharacterized protein (DUF1810 family)
VSETADGFDLDRFVNAQRSTYDVALGEIRRGRKRSHWMWFIFPQFAGLGHSVMARRFAIRTLAEAQAYLGHSILGSRLRECVAALQDLSVADAAAVFGNIDAIKLRSSLTLFKRAGAGDMFEATIDRWFAGQEDPATIQSLQSAIS